MIGSAGERRRALVAVLLAVLLSTVAVVALQQRQRLADLPLYAATAALGADGQPQLVLPGALALGDAVVPGTRVVPGSRADTLVAAEKSWLEAGVVPTRAGVPADAGRDALLDLHVLLRPGGAAVAGWNSQWRYVWPRDAAFVVRALGAAGHRDDAAAVLDFLQRVQHEDGRFEARYRPDASGPPDDRGVQIDGSGWTLWALDHHLAGAPAEQRVAQARRWARLRERSLHAVLSALDSPSGLPAASPDYWERQEDELTLGAVAPLLAGLQAETALAADLAGPRPAAQVEAAASALERALLQRWRPAGFTRTADDDGMDAAVTFLLPPFVTLTAAQDRDAVARAWSRALTQLARPGGGLAPGADWSRDGVSWTPETGLFALTAGAAGRRDVEARLLTWLADHRTAAGSYPEKVLHDGRPAAVAPLAWTAALVVLTLAQD